MKGKEKRYSPSFVFDLKHAVDYYDGISDRTGDRFRTELQAKLDVISSVSEGFAIVHNGVRAARLRKFPYVLLYRSFERHVEFIGLVHGSTSRSNWFDRPE